MTFFSRFLGNRQKPRGKFGKTFFFFLFRRTLDFLGKIGVSSRKDLFFWRLPKKFFWVPFFFVENTCSLCSWPWPRAFLPLASKGSVSRTPVLGLGRRIFFCVLGHGLEGCVLDSTSANNFKQQRLG